MKSCSSPSNEGILVVSASEDMALFVFENRLYSFIDDAVSPVYYEESLEEAVSAASTDIFKALEEENRGAAEKRLLEFSDWLSEYLWFEGLKIRGVVLSEDSSPHNDGISPEAKAFGNSWVSGNRQAVLRDLKRLPPAERKVILSDMREFFEKSGKAEELRSLLDKLEEATDRELSEEKSMKEASFSGSLSEMVAFYALVDGMADEAEENAISGIHGPGYELTNTVPEWFREKQIDMSEAVSSLVPSADKTVAQAEKALGVSLSDLYEEFGDDVPYLVYMQSAGHGVGFWDGNEAGEKISELGGNPNASFYTDLSSDARAAAYDVFASAGLVESSVAKGKIDMKERDTDSPVEKD